MPLLSPRMNPETNMKKKSEEEYEDEENSKRSPIITGKLLIASMSCKHSMWIYSFRFVEAVSWFLLQVVTLASEMAPWPTAPQDAIASRERKAGTFQ